METFRETLSKLLLPIGIALAATGIHPHLVSMSGIVFGCISAYLFLSGRLMLAVVFFALSGLSDAVDGTVARMRGIVSPFGSFMDNFCSLYTDSAALAGLILADLCSPWWGLAAVVGTFARLFTFRLSGLVPAEEAQALHTRFPYALAGKGDRIVLIALGVVLGRINEAVVVMALSTNFVAIYRGLYLYSRESSSADQA